MKYISPLTISAGCVIFILCTLSSGKNRDSRTLYGGKLQVAFQLSELHRHASLSKHHVVQSSSRIPCWSMAKKFDEGENDNLQEIKIQNSRSNENIFIHFSRAFQQHVVFQGQRFNRQDSEVLKCFHFLDEALEAYPHAKLLKLNDIGVTNDCDNFELILAGMGITPSISMMLSNHNAVEYSTVNFIDESTFASRTKNKVSIDMQGLTSLQYLTSLVLDGNRHQMERYRENFAHMLKNNISIRRFAAHTPKSIQHNYDGVLGILTRGRKLMGISGDTSSSLLPLGLGFTEVGAKALIADFPQLCLYEMHEVEERIRFLISPLIPQQGHADYHHVSRHGRRKEVHIDLFKQMHAGFGAGLSIDQATKAIKAVPQLLAIYHEDARKPSVMHFYNNLQVSSESVDMARKELSTTYLAGCTSSDIFTFGYIHSLGVEWNQIRLLLDAFPTLTFCDQEPGWELLDYGPVRSELKESTLIFLRKRLQVHNADLYAMLKTHSRLSTYNVQSNILPTMNALQSRLDLSSRELRRLLFRMPSLIGMNVNRLNSVSTLDKKIDFFKDEAQMNASDLKGAILKQPSLLQYSIEASLRPKLNFLINELSIPKPALSRIIYIAPAIMGLSLEHNLRPTVSFISDRCSSMTVEQFAMIIESVPSILLGSLIGKIEPCLSFLSTMLMLSNPEDLTALVLRAPRVLLQSVETSLAPKFQMMVEALDTENTVKGKGLSEENLAEVAACILSTNPALLVTTNSILQSRLEKYLEEPHLSLKELLQPCKIGRKRKFDSVVERELKLPTRRPSSPRKKRSVVEISYDGTHILKVFPNVQNAAKELNVSPSTVYAACGKNRQLRGRTLKYSDDLPFEVGKLDAGKVSQTKQYTNKKNWIDMLDVARLTLYDIEMKESKVSILAFVSGGTYPSDDINDARGRRKAGGLALNFPQVKLSGSNIVEKFRLSTKQSFGMIMPEGDGGSNANEGLVLVGFPFLRPSRNRCDLYACHGAIKVVLQLLKQSAVEKDMQNIDVDIEICSDSSYACNLLRDPKTVTHWGSASTIESFELDGAYPKNPDLLYPLAKTVHRIVNNDVTDKRGKKLCLGNKINIVFRHSADVLSVKITDGYISKLNVCAKKTATWQFNKG